MIENASRQIRSRFGRQGEHATDSFSRFLGLKIWIRGRQDDRSWLSWPIETSRALRLARARNKRDGRAAGGNEIIQTLALFPTPRACNSQSTPPCKGKAKVMIASKGEVAVEEARDLVL